jgi:4-oxalocrotonate tautomerase
MPLAKVHVPADTLTAEQRREIVKGIHEVINRVQRRSPENQVRSYVVIDEVPRGDWGNSGLIYAPRT